MGVDTGCGFKEIYRFPHTLLLLYLYFFAAASLLFCSFKKMFFVLCNNKLDLFTLWLLAIYSKAVYPVLL